MNRSGEFGPFASAGISISISNQQLPAQHFRHGPLHDQLYSGSAPMITHPDHPSMVHLPPTSPPPQDQCLFLHYYKMKRRFWWPFKDAMQAAAGPHQLPPGPDDPGAGPSVPVNVYEFEPEGVPGQGEVSISLRAQCSSSHLSRATIQ